MLMEDQAEAEAVTAMAEVVMAEAMVVETK